MVKNQKELTDIARSLLYHITISCVTLGMGIIYLPLLAINHSALKYKIPRQWTGAALALQKHILKLDYKVIQHTDFAKDGAIYAVKHQSAWETIALWYILDHPVFVLKKELLSIPVFGWYLSKADNIVIDRSAGQKAVGQIITQSMNYLTHNRNIVIFPEGTRTKPDSKVRYKTGIANVYEALNPPVYPVALNSGVFWQRNSFLRRSGTVEIEVFAPLETGLEKKEFMRKLETTIETATAKLVESPIYPSEPEHY